jgi:hypothetical protein
MTYTGYQGYHRKGETSFHEAIIQQQIPSTQFEDLYSAELKQSIFF